MKMIQKFWTILDYSGHFVNSLLADVSVVASNHEAVAAAWSSLRPASANGSGLLWRNQAFEKLDFSNLQLDNVGYRHLTHSDTF